MLDIDESTAKALAAELNSLQQRVTGVRAWVVGGVDGMLLMHAGSGGLEPYDLAALAAASLGVGRQAAASPRQGPFLECTVHSQRGYFSVYALGDVLLLALAGDDSLNVARLHLEARALIPRLIEMLKGLKPRFTAFDPA